MNKRNDIKELVANMDCGSCGKHYELVNIDEVRQREDFSFFHVYCPSCNNTGLVIVDIKGDR